MTTLNKNTTVLMVDDEEDDYFILRDSFLEYNILNKIARIEDGIELIPFLKKEGKYFDKELPILILLDLTMPKRNGYEALLELKSDLQFKSIPVIAFTTSSNEKDIEKMYQAGVNAFITKPSSLNRIT